MNKRESFKLFIEQEYETHPYLTPILVLTVLVFIAFL